MQPMLADLARGLVRQVDQITTEVARELQKAINPRCMLCPTGQRKEETAVVREMSDHSGGGGGGDRGGTTTLIACDECWGQLSR